MSTPPFPYFPSLSCDRNDVGDLLPCSSQLEKPGISFTTLSGAWAGEHGTKSGDFCARPGFDRECHAWTAVPPASIRPSAVGKQAPGQGAAEALLGYLLGRPRWKKERGRRKRERVPRGEVIPPGFRLERTRGRREERSPGWLEEEIQKSRVLFSI